MPDFNDDLAAGYPPHLKHLAPTQADLDMVLEEATGKPVDKGSAAANAAALRQRIAQLTDQHDRLGARLQSGETELAAMVADIAADLTQAKALLAGYENQLDQLN